MTQSSNTRVPFAANVDGAELITVCNIISPIGLALVLQEAINARMAELVGLTYKITHVRRFDTGPIPVYAPVRAPDGIVIDWMAFCAYAEITNPYLTLAHVGGTKGTVVADDYKSTRLALLADVGRAREFLTRRRVRVDKARAALQEIDALRARLSAQLVECATRRHVDDTQAHIRDMQGMIPAPTVQQLRTLYFLSRWIGEHTTSPSFRQLAAYAGLRSVRTVTEHVCILRRKHLVEHHEGEAHTLFITVKGRSLLAQYDPAELEAIRPGTHAKMTDLCKREQGD